MTSADEPAPPARGEQRLLTVPQVATSLSCSERHVWRLIKEGEIEAFRHRGLTRVTEEALRRFIEKHRK